MVHTHLPLAFLLLTKFLGQEREHGLAVVGAAVVVGVVVVVVLSVVEGGRPCCRSLPDWTTWRFRLASQASISA